MGSLELCGSCSGLLLSGLLLSGLLLSGLLVPGVYAPDFPKTIFVYAGGFGDVKGNVGDYDQPFFEASYLSGILAAGVQGKGNVAGAGGFEIPVCYSMFEAFLAGAKEVLPATTGSGQ